MAIELERLEVEVLRRLSMLSEGATQTLESSICHLHAESSFPPGFSETLQSDLSPEHSILAFHQRRMSQARQRGASVRLRAIVEASYDLDTHRKRPPSYISPDSDQNADERDDAIMRWRGYAPEWPSVYEHCSTAYVCKLRRQRSANPMTGEPLTKLLDVA